VVNHHDESHMNDNPNPICHPPNMRVTSKWIDVHSKSPLVVVVGYSHPLESMGIWIDQWNIHLHLFHYRSLNMVPSCQHNWPRIPKRWRIFQDVCTHMHLLVVYKYCNKQINSQKSLGLGL
jgi:hypothetical protein